MNKLKQYIEDVLPSYLFYLTIILGVLSVGCGILLLSFYDILKPLRFMLWNIFLGGIPLLFAFGIVKSVKGKKSKIATAILSIFWFFFFPNAPYIITDLIHSRRYDYVFTYPKFGFLPDISAWFALLFLVIGVITGCLLGLISLYLLHRLLADYLGEKITWLLVVGMSLLSGIAIHIGRFMRFNSWDIVVRPHIILRDIWLSLSKETFLFYLVFALMTFIPYHLFYIMVHHTADKKIPS